MIKGQSRSEKSFFLLEVDRGRKRLQLQGEFHI